VVRGKLARALAWLSALGGLGLIAVSLDWVPARQPEPPQRSRLEPRELVPPSPAAPPKSPSNAVDAPAAPPVLAWSIPLCDAPAKGARMFRVSLGGARETLFVWCKGEYLRLDLVLDEGEPRAQRVARFPVRAELPGGVVGADFDGDGVTDLVLGSAPPAQAVHRPGAGAFFVRGRREGGYEPARALVETPVSALAALALDEQPGNELLLLTRGDLTAQRAGELWLFQGGSGGFKRAAQIPLGLGPRDLVLLQGEGDSGRRALAALPQQGQLASIELVPALLSGQSATKQLSPAPGVQGLMADPGGASRLVLARDPTDVRRVPTEAGAGSETTLQAWAPGASVGPGVVADLDGDSQPELLAVIAQGVARVLGPTAAEEELSLSGQVVDVTTLHDAAQRERAVALWIEPGSPQLSLVVLPRPPWSAGLKLSVRAGELRDAGEGLAVVALE
jgi:hypothetical protein